MPDFPSLAALNDWLETRCRELWAQTLHGSQPGAIVDVWAEEVGRLMQLSRPFDGFVEYAKRVSPTCLVHLDRNRYSVPASFANRPVSVRVYPERIVVAAEGQVVCEHRRVFARSHQRKSTTTVFDWRHYLAVIQRKPGALRNGVPFAELPPAFRALQQRMLKTPGCDREMVEILALVLQHDEQAVLAAVELALEAGAPTKTHILNLLHRLVDGKPMDTPPIKAPIRQIAENAGVEGSIVVGKITENKSQTYGFDAQTEQYVDMLSAGIVDPAKVVRVALQTPRRSPA